MAKRLKKHRDRLGLSAENYGMLIGASGLMIYKLGAVKGASQREQYEALTAIMGLGSAKRLSYRRNPQKWRASPD